MIAANLRSVSGGGRGFRYGGEEFVVIFAGKLVAEVEPYLERLRVQIERTKFVVRSRKRPRKKPDYVKPSKVGSLTLKVTVSIGAAERSERLPEAAQVIKEADQALYRAKKEGRNRVCC